jgi:hypothetical protein
MTQHKVMIRSIKLPTGEEVDLKYWGGGTSIYVAGFIGDKQVTVEKYSGKVDIADDFDATFQQSLISGLASTAESDLLTNPCLHFRP